jgi:hypothetical protein
MQKRNASISYLYLKDRQHLVQEISIVIQLKQLATKVQVSNPHAKCLNKCYPLNQY